MKNHYEILEIDTTASRAEIDKAYNNLSRQFHPDKNGGVKYFDDLYIQINDAYKILSEDDLRTNYDLEKGFIQKGEPEPELIENEPEILLFESDREIFEEGDNIKITWQTKNADKVIIKPFGEVETSGSKIYRLKNYQKEALILTLKGTNSTSEIFSTRSLTLKNKVTEIDFSNLNDVNSEETTNSDLEEDYEVHSNSFTSAADNRIIETTAESFFSSKGRLRRSTYFVRVLLLAIPAGIAYAILESSSNYYSGYDESALLFTGLTIIVISFLSFLQYIKRLHDINMSGWWALVAIIPYAGGLFGLITALIDGQKGPNEYGEDPKGRL